MNQSTQILPDNNLTDDIEITTKEIDSALNEFSEDYGYILKRPRNIQILNVVT